MKLRTRLRIRSPGNFFRRSIVRPLVVGLTAITLLTTTGCKDDAPRRDKVVKVEKTKLKELDESTKDLLKASLSLNSSEDVIDETFDKLMDYVSNDFDISEFFPIIESLKAHKDKKVVAKAKAFLVINEIIDAVRSVKNGNEPKVFTKENFPETFANIDCDDPDLCAAVAGSIGLLADSEKFGVKFDDIRPLFFKLFKRIKDVDQVATYFLFMGTQGKGSDLSGFEPVMGKLADDLFTSNASFASALLRELSHENDLPLRKIANALNKLRDPWVISNLIEAVGNAAKREQKIPKSVVPAIRNARKRKLDSPYRSVAQGLCDSIRGGVITVNDVSFGYVEDEDEAKAQLKKKCKKKRLSNKEAQELMGLLYVDSYGKHPAGLLDVWNWQGNLSNTCTGTYFSDHDQISHANGVFCDTAESLAHLGVDITLLMPELVDLLRVHDLRFDPSSASSAILAGVENGARIKPLIPKIISGMDEYGDGVKEDLSRAIELANK